MARIYTKRGDQGSTSLFGGGAVTKAEPRLEAYGTVDELNSVLGLCRSQLSQLGTAAHDLDKILFKTQKYLFTVGSHLALGDPTWATKLPLVDPDKTTELERHIDQMEGHLEPLTNFILPGGSLASAHLHLARTVCRRAERAIVAVNPAVDPQILAYVNRLSDFLFVAARFANRLAGAKDIIWEKP